MTENTKQYGLLVPKKNAQCLQPRPSIFGDDSDSDTGEGANSASKAFANVNVQKRQTQLDMKRALEQDPTVYQYDEVYDAMEEKKMEQRMKKKDPEKKPKYIQALLATAERRKREQERRTERKVQKEREAEGEEFKDKESFVTSAYRKKLEEFQAMDEQERLQEKLEELTDVAKQNDLSGFYRHLYRQKVCDKEESEPPLAKVKEEKSIEEDLYVKRDDEEFFHSKGTEKASFPEGMSSSDCGSKGEERQYRKRKMSSSSEAESDRDQEGKRREKGEDMSSRDTSCSSSGSSSESEDKEMEGKSRVESGAKQSEGEEKEGNNEKGRKKGNKLDCEKKEEDVKMQENGISHSVDKPSVEPKPNIWEKKTVGPVFDMALQKYLARKAARMAAM